MKNWILLVIFSPLCLFGQERKEIDSLKNSTFNFEYVAIKKISGLTVTRNYLDIKNEIEKANKYKLVSKDSIGGLTRAEKKRKKRYDKAGLIEPVIPDEFLQNPQTLFLEFNKQALGKHTRITTFELKNADGVLLFRSESKNKTYIEILKPLTTDYNNSSEDALKEIRKLKELLDLGLITQENYDEKAAELKRLILQN